MAGFTDATEQGLLDYFVATYGETTKYIALYTGTPSTDTGTGLTEVTGSGYARVATTSADWAAATGTAPATKATSTTKTFPTATGDWAAAVNVTYFGLCSAPTAGTLRAFGALATPKPVLNGDTASFTSGALVLKFGDPSDTYT
jgi:hypothetical protein